MSTSPAKEITKLSQRGLQFIADKEGGFILKPYLDQIGVPTISAGCTYYENGNKVKMTDPKITLERAKELFNHLLTGYELGVYSHTRDDINQNQFDALVDFSYNLGVGALAGSTLLKKVNANPNDPSIRDEFDKWVYAGGKKSKGLIIRRKQEADLYFSNS